MIQEPPRNGKARRALPLRVLVSSGWLLSFCAAQRQVPSSVERRRVVAHESLERARDLAGDLLDSPEEARGFSAAQQIHEFQNAVDVPCRQAHLRKRFSRCLSGNVDVLDLPAPNLRKRRRDVVEADTRRTAHPITLPLLTALGQCNNSDGGEVERVG